ncbi:hypothetical protein A5690_04790, partial [Mycobacterium intracellulare]|uniref:hypothetical protein n=1 Tax=Mycobacterium intracellulare TaxID=1767 RepID=UPI0007E98713
MPKKSLRPPAPPESGPNGPLLGTWQAAGLSMALIASAAADGLGALLGAVTVIPVIYALTRLRAYAPHARSTAELIGATLGPRAGFAAGAIQLLAYLALAAKFAVALGAVVLVDFSSGDDPAKVVLWLPVCALVAALAVGAVVCWVTTRVVASVVAPLVVAVVIGAAVIMWVGDHQGVAGPWRWNAKFLTEAVPEFYADAGWTWMAVAGVALTAAAALASGWAAVRVAAGLAAAREATPNTGLRVAVVGLVAAMAAILSAHGMRVITTVVFGAAALLLVLLYVFATEANSRIPGDSLVAWWVRLIVPALAAVLVV